MKIFANKEIKHFFLAIFSAMTAFFLLCQLAVYLTFGALSLPLLFLFPAALCSVLAICVWYFRRQNELLETAVSRINDYLDGDKNVRIDCDSEGEMYRLFHSVNTLAAILNAHAEKELRAKDFLKDTISDISHQLKTPLAALNIYNDLLREEAKDLPAIREFADLSGQELDRIEMLVQNLLKITRLDAGSIVIEKNPEYVSDMIKDIELHFACRARQEQKAVILSGDDRILLLCDRDWIIEAISNIVKNALDHTKAGDSVHITWKQSTSVVQIIVKDNGSGIHPEDLHHIFKRFYRSRFSKDIQGIGLGLPLAKAIIEAHGGTIEVSSELNAGTVFTINFLIPTKL